MAKFSKMSLGWGKLSPSIVMTTEAPHTCLSNFGCHTQTKQSKEGDLREGTESKQVVLECEA